MHWRTRPGLPLIPSFDACASGLPTSAASRARADSRAVVAEQLLRRVTPFPRTGFQILSGMLPGGASVPIFATVLVICALPPDGTGVDAEDAEPPQSFGGLCSDLMKNHGSSLFLLCVVWFGLNFGSYGLSSWITVLLNAVARDTTRSSLAS